MFDDLLARRLGNRAVPRVREAGGHAEDARGAGGLFAPLLFEHQVDLRAGEGHRHERVAERLDGERLAVGHIGGSGRGRVQVRTDAARVHERRDGARGVAVAASCASAITLPSGDSSTTCARSSGPLDQPMTRPASGAASAR